MYTDLGSPAPSPFAQEYESIRQAEQARWDLEVARRELARVNKTANEKLQSIENRATRITSLAGDSLAALGARQYATLECTAR